MHWYLVHTKPRQEKCTLENLQRQGFQCYLPTLPSQKLRQGVLTVADKALFPRYLFICLGQGDSAPSCALIRPIKGANRLVSFGVEPAKVADSLVEARGICSGRAGAPVQARRARAPHRSAVRRHRRRVPNGRWRAPLHGVERTALQASTGASCTGQPSQDWLKLGRNISQSHDGVAKCSHSVGLLQHTAAPRNPPVGYC